MIKNTQEIKKFKEQISKDFDTTALFAHETINDYNAEEIELDECATFIRLCIRRIKILNKAVKNSGIFSNAYIENFDKNSNTLLEEIKPYQGNKDLVLHEPSLLMCNSILKVFQANYQSHIDKSENLFEM